MSIFFNLGSLILGIISWIIPVVAVFQDREWRKPIFFSIYSFTACCLALIFQLFEIRHRANMSDSAGILDTIGGVAVAAVVLVVITLVLNVTAAILCKRKNK